MHSQIRRREFLVSAGVAAASTAARAGFAAAAGYPAIRGASSPASAVTSASAPRLFVGCCAYSYQAQFEKGHLTMEEFIQKSVELGVHGVDITTYWLKSTEPDYLTGLRHLAFKNGMPFSGAAIGTDMCQPNDSKRAEELEKIKKWVDATERLGASHLRVFGGAIPKGATIDQGVQWVVETMKPACDYSAKKGITLGIESHGGITSRAKPILEILRGVDSPYAAINLDISNFSADTDEDQYTQIEACVPLASHTHIRDHFSNNQHPIDLDRVWKLFARAGYKGYMSAEYEGEEDPTTGVPKLIEKIKTLCKKYSSA